MDNISELNDCYKLESLGILPDYCLQEIFSREFRNADIAKISIITSTTTRNKIISNLNVVRAEKVSALLAKYEDGKLELTPSSFEKTCELLMDRVQILKDKGVIQIPTPGMDSPFLNLSDDLNNFSDSLPPFSLHHVDLHDLIAWWDLAAKNMRTIYGKGAQLEDIILQRLDDDYSALLFAHSIDDIPDSTLAEIEKTLRNDTLEDSRKRLAMVESFLTALAAGHSNRELASDLSLNFPDHSQFMDRLTKHGPLLLIPAVKQNQPLEDIAFSLYKLKLIHDEQGSDEMLKFAGKVEEHFFRRGLAVVLSGMDFAFIRKIISERKKAQLEEIEIKLKMITDAIMCIRNKVSSYIMLELMSSYTVYDFEE